MNYEIERVDDVEVVRILEAKIGYPSLEALQRELELRIENGARKMLVNLSSVSFVDSFGVGVIAATLRHMEQAGGALRLCGVGDRVRMSLTITRLDKKLTIDPDEATALESFRG